MGLLFRAVIWGILWIIGLVGALAALILDAPLWVTLVVWLAGSGIFCGFFITCLYTNAEVNNKYGSEKLKTTLGWLMILSGVIVPIIINKLCQYTRLGYFACGYVECDEDEQP